MVKLEVQLLYFLPISSSRSIELVVDIDSTGLAICLNEGGGLGSEISRMDLECWTLACLGRSW
jgi:hypothetical protein